MLGPAKLLMVFNDTEIVSCSQTCTLRNLLARINVEDGEMDSAEVLKLCTELARKQKNLTGMFVETRTDKFATDLCKDTKRKIKEYGEKLEKYMEKPKDKAEIVKNMKALGAWQKELLAQVQKWSNDGDIIADEEYTEGIREFQDKRLAHLKKQRANAREIEDNGKRLAKALEAAPQYLEQIQKNYEELVKPILVPMIEEIKALKEAEAQLEAAQDKVAGHHKTLMATHDDERFVFTEMYGRLIAILDEIHKTARVSSDIAIKANLEKATLREAEKNMLKALHKTGKMTEEQKQIYENFEMNFKEEEEEPLPGQGRFLLESKDIIAKICEELNKITDFARTRELGNHLVKLEKVKAGCARWQAELVMEDHEAEQKKKVVLNKINCDALKRCREIINEKIAEAKTQKEAFATLQIEKENAEKKAEEYKSECAALKLALDDLQKFADLAQKINKPRDEQDGYRRVEHRQRGGRQHRQHQHDHDAQAGVGERKRNADASNSLFALRTAEGKSYCQFQFTNADGCMKKEKCLYASTHGMEDPHPNHESRVFANKRAKGDPEKKHDE